MNPLLPSGWSTTNAALYSTDDCILLYVLPTFMVVCGNHISLFYCSINLIDAGGLGRRGLNT